MASLALALLLLVQGRVASCGALSMATPAFSAQPFELDFEHKPLLIANEAAAPFKGS